MGASPDDLHALELLRELDDPAFFARVAPSLARLVADRPTSPGEGASTARGVVTDHLAREGWLRIDGFLEDAELEALHEAVLGFLAVDLPPTFLYVLDGVWSIGERVAARLSETTGVRYHLADDAWAFHVPPGPESAGWSPHRGTYDVAPDRAAPDTVNVWIALTEADLASSCMYLVPLDRDPSYPSDLRSHDAAGSEGVPLVAAAGTALAWNANALHWGGPSSERARGPRMSVTFTLVRADRHGDRAPATELGAAHADRLDLVATQLRVYGEVDRGVPAPVRRWAELRLELRNLARSPGFGPSEPAT